MDEVEGLERLMLKNGDVGVYREGFGVNWRNGSESSCAV